jgi:hypothetical protein
MGPGVLEQLHPSLLPPAPRLPPPSLFFFFSFLRRRHKAAVRLWHRDDLPALLDLLEVPESWYPLMSPAVRWPEQPWMLALAAGHGLGLHGLQREFYHPLQSWVSGSTQPELELLSKLAARGDWLAHDTLGQLLGDEAQAMRLASREAQLLSLLKAPDASSIIPACSAVAYGTWLRAFGSAAGSAQQLWQLHCNDPRVQAMLARCATQQHPAHSAAEPQNQAPDVTRDLLVLARDADGLRDRGQNLLQTGTDTPVAADMLYRAGLAFLHGERPQLASQCLAVAAAHGHESAAHLFLQQHIDHTLNLVTLEQVLASGRQPAPFLVLALAWCKFRHGDRDSARRLLIGNDRPVDVRVHGEALVAMGFWTDDQLAQKLQDLEELLSARMASIEFL